MVPLIMLTVPPTPPTLYAVSLNCLSDSNCLNPSPSVGGVTPLKSFAAISAPSRMAVAYPLLDAAAVMDGGLPLVCTFHEKALPVFARREKRSPLADIT